MRRRLLLVDDENDIRLIGRLGLEATEEYEVLLAGSGFEALEAAEREQPSVILLDVMMPGLDGLATLERLRASSATRDIPVIIMSARVQRRETAQYMALGAAGVIPKPFDPLTLSAEVSRIVDSPARPR